MLPVRAAFADREKNRQSLVSGGSATLRFKDHIQTLAQRAEKRLNILRILAWGGTEPKTLIRLYKVCQIDF